MIRVTKHSKERLIERTEAVNNFSEAKRYAKQAMISGKTINSYQKCPEFADYLRKKKLQSNYCTIRVYRDNIYIWRGKSKTLVTVLTIPEKFLIEIQENNKSDL